MLSLIAMTGDALGHNASIITPTPSSFKPWVNIHPQDIYFMLATSSVLSILGSIFVSVSWLCFKSLRFFSRKLIFFIALTDLGSSAAFLWSALRQGGDVNDLECRTQGYLLQFFVLSSYLWTSCFAFHLH